MAEPSGSQDFADTMPPGAPARPADAWLPLGAGISSAGAVIRGPGLHDPQRELAGPVPRRPAIARAAFGW